MKTYWLALGSALCVLTGCVSTHSVVVTEPVGPSKPVAQSPATTGDLIVYSAWDKFDTLDTRHQKHTPYTVQSMAGAEVSRVQNRHGSFGENPDVVALPPGDYVVLARATNRGRVQVPVIIRKGESTVVHLDGSTGDAEIAQQARAK